MNEVIKSFKRVRSNELAELCYESLLKADPWIRTLFKIPTLSG